MAEYRLALALPQSPSGSEEFHYGYLCKVKPNGVWIELNQTDAQNFLAGGRIYGPVVQDEVKRVEVKEPAKVEDVKGKAIHLKHGEIHDKDKDALEFYAAKHYQITLDKRKGFDALLDIVKDFEKTKV